MQTQTTKRDTSYNGHKNWTHWNVSLWINNDEGLYRMALDYKRRFKAGAARHMLADLPAKTPDRANYSHPSLKTALSDLE